MSAGRLSTPCQGIIRPRLSPARDSCMTDRFGRVNASIAAVLVPEMLEGLPPAHLPGAAVLSGSSSGGRRERSTSQLLDRTNAFVDANDAEDRGLQLLDPATDGPAITTGQPT